MYLSRGEYSVIVGSHVILELAIFDYSLSFLIFGFLIMDCKTCKGCNTRIAKPVVCPFCDVVAHPGSLAKTGHPFANGRFTTCSLSPSKTVGRDDESLIKMIQNIVEKSVGAIIRSELAKFQEKFWERLSRS